MKMMFICSFLLTVQPAAFAQSPIVWQPERQISSDSVNLTGARVFAVGDTVHAFWQQIIGANRAYYRRSTDGGVTFSPPRTVWADSGVLLNSGSTRDIAVHNSNIYVLWETCDTCSGQYFWATFRRSTDAGSTFEPYRKLFPAARVTAITTDDSTVIFRRGNRELTQDWLALSDDYGTTWQDIPFWFRNFQKLRLAGNHLHMTEAAQGTGQLDVAYRYSGDFGSTWTNPLILSTIDNYTSDAGNAALNANEDGRPYVAWGDGKYGGTNPFVGSILVRHSTDLGNIWTPESLLTQIPSGSVPNLATESSNTAGNEYVGVVWHNESQPFLGVSLRLSTDGGVSWLPHMSVSDSSVQALYPDIAIASGKVHIVWAKRQAGLRDRIFYRRGQIALADVSPGAGLPALVHLLPAYPNPFNSSTTINYTLDKRMLVELTIYNILGRKISLLVQEVQEAGLHHVRFDARDKASGLYFVRLTVPEKVLTNKVILLK